MSAHRQPQVFAVATAAQTSADAYAAVAGSVLDTASYGGLRVGYQFTENNVNAVTVKVQGSIDNATWTDVLTLDTDGSQRAGVDIAILKNASATAFVAPEQTNKAAHAWRYYRAAVKSTVSSTHGSITVKGYLK